MLRQKSINDILLNSSCAILSGILAFLAFPPFKLGILAWVCLVPLLFAIKRSDRKLSFWHSYLCGVVFFSCLLYWLPRVTVPGTIILIFALSVFFGLFGLVAKIVFKYSADILILPFVWVVLEYIRGHLFTGFPWGLFAYTQYENINLIQVADITGAYGVSFLIVAFNMALFGFLTRIERKISYMMVALFFILVSTIYGIYRLDNFFVWGSPRIGVVQGNVPQQFKWDPDHADYIIKEYKTLTREANANTPDIIIWPETAYPNLVSNAKNGARKIRDLAKELNVPILMGAIYDDGRNFYNSAILYSGEGEFMEKYDKLHLVPFGEFVPFENRLPFIRKYIDKPIGDFKKGDEYTLFPMKSISSTNLASGTRTRQTIFYKFGVLICFEDIFPHLAREYALKGTNFLVNITNDAWFGRTAAPEQHLQASVFRAVENRCPVIRAANTGVSGFVDSTGIILSRVKKDGKDIMVSGYATENVRIYGNRSFYTTYGDVFVYFCGFMLILLFATEGFLSRKNNPNKGQV